MPRKHASIKALRQSKRHAVSNDARRRAIEIAFRHYRAAKSGGKSDAMQLLFTLVKAIDKAAQRHVVSKNTAARIKSRVMRVKKASL